MKKKAAIAFLAVLVSGSAGPVINEGLVIGAVFVLCFAGMITARHPDLGQRANGRSGK